VSGVTPMSQSVAVSRRSPSLQRAFGRVGEPEAEFRSRAVMPILLVMGGVLLLAVGAVLLWYFARLLLVLPAFSGLTLLPLAFGFVAAAYGWRLWGECWFVCSGGVVR